MAVSEDRIDELFEQMLANADEEGWCHIPEGVTDEENKELSRRITIMTMQDRIDGLNEGIEKVMKYMRDVKKHLDEYDTMDQIKIKGGLETIKEDSQTILIDLHSDDKIGDFFRIGLVSYEDSESTENMENARKEMEELIVTEFKESLEKIKNSCTEMISKADEIIGKLDIK